MVGLPGTLAPAERERGWALPLRWVGVLAAVLLCVPLVALVGDALRERAQARREAAAALREWPERPLPREWRWEGRRYDFDRMFRTPR